MSKIYLTSSIDIVADRIGMELKAKEKKLKLVFVNTASEIKTGDKEWLRKDRQSLVDAGFIVSDFTLTGKNVNEIEEVLEKADVIHMEGGDTFYLLYQIQQSKCESLIKEMVMGGKIYIGSSAGSIVAGPDIQPTYRLEQKEWVDKMKNNTKGLGLVDLVIMPHWGSDHFKELYLNHRLEHAYNTDFKLMFLNDFQYVKFDNTQMSFMDVRTK